MTVYQAMEVNIMVICPLAGLVQPVPQADCEIAFGISKIIGLVVP